MAHGGTARPSRRFDWPAWIGELALVLIWPLSIAMAWVLGALFGAEFLVPLLTASVLGWGFACLGGLARSDPIGFISIVAPPFAVAIVALAVEVSGGRAATLMLVAGAWVLAWTLAGSRLWPAWSRIVLRRYRPGSPEVELYRSWQDLSRLWPAASTAQDRQAVWAGLIALERWETPRTRPVIDGLFAFWDLTYFSDPEASRIERVIARLREESGRLMRPPRLRLPGHRADPFDRPTRGTRLEYLYPTLEALIAVALPEQRRRIAAESARLALRDADLADPTLEAALDEAARGKPEPDTRRQIEARLGIAREARDALSGPDDTNEATWTRLAREAVVLSAVFGALGDELPPVAAANVVYESIRSEHERSPAFERLITDIVGPDAAAKAVVIEPVELGPGERTDQASSGQDEAAASILASQTRNRDGLARLAVLGFAAGFAGTILRQLAWSIEAGLPNPHFLDLAVGQMLVGLAGYGLIRVAFGRPSFLDVLVLFVASFVAGQLAGPLFDLTSNVLAPFAGPAWTDFFADPDNVVAYSPWHGLAFAATLLAGSLLLPPPFRSTSAQPADAG